MQMNTINQAWMSLPAMPRPLRLAPMLLLLVFSQLNSCIRETDFHTVFTSGEKPPNNLACATKCGEDDACVGYDVTDGACEVLTSSDYDENVGHWVYHSPERVAAAEPPIVEMPPCIPIAIRESSSNCYIFYNGNDKMWKFAISNTASILSGTFSSEKSVAQQHPDANGRSPDAAWKFDGDVILYFGNEVEIHDYTSAGHYSVYTGYPKLLSEELGTTSCPTSLNAANLMGNTLYLLQGNIMYSYKVSGGSPNIGYQFLAEFDYTVNDAGNPFSPQPGSPLTSVPTGLTAMVRGSTSTTLAFAQKEMYRLNHNNGYWEHLGTVKTPCG